MGKKESVIGAVARVFAVLFLVFLSFFAILFLALGYQQNRSDLIPNGLTGKAAGIPGAFFHDLISMEIPHFKRDGASNSLSQASIAGFVSDLLFSISPDHPVSLLGAVLPRFNDRKPILLVEASQSETVYPFHYEEVSVPSGETDDQAVHDEVPDPAAAAAETESNGIHNKVFIYHSHNRESWLPELPSVTKPELAFDQNKNVTLLGERLSLQLEQLGIGAAHSKIDYKSVYGNAYDSVQSYSYSKMTVKEAIAVQSELDYFIDIHRDSNPRKHTTLQANGIDYAKVFFIVGLENAQWKQNQEFAKQLQERMENEVPGISRGIFGKTRKEGDGKYNQDLSPNSCVIEIGGVENTIEESNHTIDLLAKVMKQLIDETANRTRI